MTTQRKQSRPASTPPPRRTPWLWVGLMAVGVMALIIVAFALLRDGSNPSAAGGHSGPIVAVEKEVFDYGDVKVGTPIETIFRVRNAGNQTLKIAGDPQVELVQGC